MKKYRTGTPAEARRLAQQPETPAYDPDSTWREWLHPETPAAGQPADDLRQFCEEHIM